MLPLTCFAEPTILVFGDSLSAAYQIPPEQGWVSLLENKVKTSLPDAVVINSSISGETTAEGLNRLTPLLDKYKPDIVILELGANDGLRGLPVIDIQSNLKAMIELSLKAQAKVLLIGIHLPVNYGSTYTEQFYNVYTQMKEKYDIPLVPFLLEHVALDPQLMQADHLHPTAAAQPLLLDNVWPYLKPLLPG
jgi:acyl-CoA thioesterase-1